MYSSIFLRASTSSGRSVGAGSYIFAQCAVPASENCCNTLQKFRKIQQTFDEDCRGVGIFRLSQPQSMPRVDWSVHIQNIGGLGIKSAIIVIGSVHACFQHFFRKSGNILRKYVKYFWMKWLIVHRRVDIRALTDKEVCIEPVSKDRLIAFRSLIESELGACLVDPLAA